MCDEILGGERAFKFQDIVLMVMVMFLECWLGRNLWLESARYHCVYLLGSKLPLLSVTTDMK